MDKIWILLASGLDKRLPLKFFPKPHNNPALAPEPNPKPISSRQLKESLQ